ncbi:hypothetical protein AB0M31_24515 [Streptomyces sp. NPDC051773]|uniref:hypothetical protein n=1 Tax=Streptomyces sp. NPDC051773 TaxID=3156682 RepID=UPI003441CD68
MARHGPEPLNAHLLDLSGSKPIIGLRDTDTTAAEARVKAPEPSGTPQTTAYPDGVSFCDGNPRDHEDPREHPHHGPLIAMRAHRPYACHRRDGIMALQLTQVDDETPGLDFVADGEWPPLDLERSTN